MKSQLKKIRKARERILDAAGDIFGRRGYRAATVREICQKARVNVAAINYYFGGKQGLYRQVVRELIATTFDRHPVDCGRGPDISPQERLRFFIKGTLCRLLAPGGLSGYQGKGQLVARELADPSPILDDLVYDFVRPAALVLEKILIDLLGSRVSAQDLTRCQISVIGQCFHYAMARPILNRLAGLDLSDPASIEALADHVTLFSLAGVEEVRKRAKENLDVGKKDNRE